MWEQREHQQTTHQRRLARFFGPEAQNVRQLLRVKAANPLCLANVADLIEGLKDFVQRVNGAVVQRIVWERPPHVPKHPDALVDLALAERIGLVLGRHGNQVPRRARVALVGNMGGRAQGDAFILVLLNPFVQPLLLVAHAVVGHDGVRHDLQADGA